VSPIPDPAALAVDAITMRWDNLIAYAYPPTALIRAVLKQNQGIRESDLFGRALLATATVVHRTPRVANRSTKKNPNQVGKDPSETTQNKSLSSEPGQTKPSRLAITQESLQEGIF